jgi:hypothetical protein
MEEMASVDSKRDWAKLKYSGLLVLAWQKFLLLNSIIRQVERELPPEIHSKWKFCPI